MLDELITGSAVGVKIKIPDVRTMWAVPRIILYACDQPEERHHLGMKLSGSYFPCSVCMEFKSHNGVPSLEACKRDLLATLEDEMRATELAEKGDRPSRIEKLAKQSSIAPIVPVLGAVHGLGTGTLSLFRIFGFDRLHVSHGLLPAVLLLMWALVVSVTHALCPLRCSVPDGYGLAGCLYHVFVGVSRLLFPFLRSVSLHHKQVMKLGVLKVVSDKVPTLPFEIFGEGDARRGPKSETLVGTNERIAPMGRLILATLAPPGYVGCSVFVSRGALGLYELLPTTSVDCFL